MLEKGKALTLEDLGPSFEANNKIKQNKQQKIP